MIKLISFFLLVTISLNLAGYSQDSEPWKPEQLASPASLAAIINSSTAEKPLIIDIGPAGLIKGAVKIGAVTKKENLESLKDILKKQDRAREIIIYCGCCPYANCPNIRPAFSLLNTMKFTNYLTCPGT